LSSRAYSIIFQDVEVWMWNVSAAFVWVFASAMVLMPRAFAADVSVTPEQLSVVSAANSGDDGSLVKALDSLATDDLPHTIDYATRILTQGAAHQRPVAVAALVKYADAGALARIAARLRPDVFQDERRQLVRALGSRKGEGVLQAIEPFLRDQDLLVRAAAAACIADQKDVAGVGLLLNPPPSLTDFTEIEGRGEDRLYAISAISTIRAISGVNARDTSEILDWWRSARSRVTPEAADAKIKVPVNARLATHSFEIRFNPPAAQTIFENRMHVHSDSDWNKFVQSMENAARQDRLVAGKIFGPLYTPCCRVIFATTQTVSAEGGVSEGYGAFTGEGRITVNVELYSPIYWQTMFRHEYIHALHESQFVDQPRWLMEGMAVSLSESPFRSSWTPNRIRSAGLADGLRRGGVSATIDWISDAHSGNNEGASYALSGLVFDYLRFGGIPASEQRIFALMGALNRGGQARQTIESIYGCPITKLDSDLAKWAFELPIISLGPRT
jgi:hypothetical protein